MSNLSVNPEEATACVVQAMAANIPTMLHGNPGIGKSAIYTAIAKRFNLVLIDIRLSQTDPMDMSGVLTKIGDRGSYMPMDMWPLEGDTIPDGKAGFLIVLDEINAAPLLTQAAA